MWVWLCVALVTLLFGYAFLTSGRPQIYYVNKRGEQQKVPFLSPPIFSTPLVILRAIFVKETQFERFQIFLRTKKLAHKAGVVNFFGKIFLITWDPELCSEVFVKPNDNWQKLTQDFSQLITDLIQESVVSVEGAQWRKQRAILKPSFSYQTLRNLLPGFQQISITLCEQLEQQVTATGHFEPYTFMSHTTLDALGKCGFGMNFDALHGHMSEVYCAYEGILTAFANPLYFSNWFRRLPIAANRRLQQSMNNFWKWARITVHQQLQEMEANPDRPPNLLDLMIQSHFTENPELSEVELLQNIFLFFLAGHETTSGTLTFVLDMLARHPDVQERCREEVNSLFMLGEEPSYEKTKKLTYLSWVIKETMRMRPLVNAISRVAMQDTVVADYHIPKGTVVSCAIGNLQYDPDTWEDPDTFKPERWEGLNRSAPYFMPFGAGTRICLGMNFANLEMRVVLVNLLQRYKFEPVHDLTFQRSITLRPRDGYLLKLVRI